jgi:hypothetical protein
MSTKPETDQRSSYTPSALSAESPTAPMYDKASPIEDVVDIFYAPSTVYARRATASFWMPFLIVVAIAVVFGFVNRSYWAAATDAQFTRAMAQRAASQPMTADQIEAGRKFAEGFGRVLIFLLAPIAIFFVALWTWLACKVTSVKLTMEQAMLVVTLAFIPRLVEAVVVAAQNLLLDATITSPFTYSLNVARFLDPDAVNHRLFALAGRVDVFILWSTLLIAIGVATIARVSRSKGYATAGLVYVVSSLLLVLMS